jgi:hypothetical protein
VTSLQRSPIGQPPIQTLPGQHGKLDLGHVQPTAVLGRVVHFQPLDLGRLERLTQQRGRVVLWLSCISMITSASGW